MMITVVGKSVGRIKHRPDGYLESFDLSGIITRRFLFASLGVPITTLFHVIAVHSIFAGQIIWHNGSIIHEAIEYSIGVLICFPLMIGLATFMAGIAWLEPRLTPTRRYFTLYVCAILGANLMFALTDLGKETFAIEISFAVMTGMAFVFPHAVLIGGLQFLANASIILQYALWAHTDITAYFAVPALSFATVLVLTVRSVSQTKMNALVEQTREQAQLLNTLVRNGPHYFLVQDQDYKVVEMSEAFARDMFGASADEMIGHDVLDFRMWDPEGVERILEARKKYAPKLEDGKLIDQEYSTRTFDGKLLHLKAKYIHTQTDADAVYRYVVLQDQTDAKNTNEKLQRQAYIDTLTGLRNRPAFLDGFSGKPEMRDMNYCLFMCRVDHLAMVNQAYSIQVGDTYLKSLSKMLLGELGDNGVIYRLSDDVFMIAEQWKGETNALDFAERLKDLVGTFTIYANGYSVRQSISIGIAKLAINQDLNEALNLCQRALDAAHKKGKSQIQIANDNFIRLLDAQGAFITQKDVETALENNEFQFSMQPVIDLRTAGVENVDVKLTWKRADKEHLSFDVYRSPFLETVMKRRHDDIFSLMVSDVLTSALGANSKRVYWHSRSRVVEHRSVVQYIAQEFQKYPSIKIVLTLAAKNLLARTSRATVINNLHYLREMGVSIALDVDNLDDFNVLQITQLPIDEVVLSGKVVEDITNDRRVQERITPITKLLREFDIEIAATNISTKGQLKVVVELGIAHCSGDLFAPSVAHSAYSDLIQSLNIEPLLDDAPNIVSIRDFSAD